jgi:iron complex transport system permease protein
MNTTIPQQYKLNQNNPSQGNLDQTSKDQDNSIPIYSVSVRSLVSLTLVRFVFFVLLLLLVSTFNLTVGSAVDIGWQQLYNYMFNFDASLPQLIIGEIRLPRLLTSIIIGAHLALSGLLAQAVTRNGLASPSIFGINSGAALAMALGGIIGTVWLGIQLPMILIAFLGGLFSAVLVCLFGGLLNGQHSPLRLVLAGVAVNLFLAALIRACVILDEDLADSVLYWLVGSLENRNWQDIKTLLPWTLLCALVTIYLARGFNLLALGDDVARGLGVNALKLRILGGACAVVLAASATATCGPIGFVGLMIPHIARKLVGNDYYLLIPFSMLLGANLLVISDTLSHLIAFPYETPVGVVTALIGAPFFLYLSKKI